MGNRRWMRPAAAIGLLFAAAASSPAQDGARALAALGQVERGEWTLREAGHGASTMCVRNPAVLLQLRHGSEQCSQFVIENTARKATVHYTCPGHGHGRTTLTVETPRRLRIETQGVADGAPFASTYDAQRGGPCG